MPEMTKQLFRCPKWKECDHKGCMHYKPHDLRAEVCSIRNCQIFNDTACQPCNKSGEVIKE